MMPEGLSEREKELWLNTMEGALWRFGEAIRAFCAVCRLRVGL